MRILLAVDEAIVIHEMTPADTFSSTSRTLTLDGVIEGVEVSHVCFISHGVGIDRLAELMRQ